MRITTFDFGDGAGPVPANRHINPDGSMGGWVAKTAVVAPTVWVGWHATVFGRAKVLDKVALFQRAKVYGNAIVKDNVLLYASVEVFANAEVSADTVLLGNTSVGWNQKIAKIRRQSRKR